MSQLSRELTVDVGDDIPRLDKAKVCFCLGFGDYFSIVPFLGLFFVAKGYSKVYLQPSYAIKCKF